MNKDYFINLLHKYLKGNATAEEQQFVESYYSQFQREPDVLDMLSMEEKEEFKQDIKRSVWDSISKEEMAGHKVISLNRKLVRMAAAAAIIIIVTAGLYFFLDRSVRKQIAAIQEPAAPRKENRVIFLPDGSTVILSPGSKLNYPSTFDGLAKREVFLEGQAFFDIKHNSSRSFIVHTGNLETVVLGTSFNIKAFAGDKEIIVTVKSGKVKVSDENKVLGIITPNQQIAYSKDKVSADLRSVSSDKYLDWKDQDLFIDNLTIAEAAKLMEERYNVKIIIKDQLIESQRFTTTFPKQETFEHELKSICVFNGLTYNYNKEDSTVIISNK